MARALTLVIAAVLALAPAAAAGTKQRVPVGFLGVNAGGGTLLEHADLEREYSVMLGAGVQSVRQPFQWDITQPYPTWAEVPPEHAAAFRDEGGVPTDWRFIDRQVAAAASRRMRMVAVVHGAPPWAQRHPGHFSSPPRDPAEYARFVGSLVRRYGTAGTFWAERPDLPRMPVRDWQIWNEPNIRPFWSDDPWARDYVALMRESRKAIKAADRRGRLVLAGLPNDSWNALAKIYRARGRAYFDVVAIHPFTSGVDGVLTILRKDRRVMARYGDKRKPLVVTETSWTSSKGKTNTGESWQVTEKGQAQKVRHLLRLMARVRRPLRIEGVYWFTWMTEDRAKDYSFDYAGLRRLRPGGRPRSKPALAAYRRTALDLSGCRSKADAADRCGS